MGKFPKKVLGLSLGFLIFASPFSAFASTDIQTLKIEKAKIEKQSQALQNELAKNKDEIHTLTGKISDTQIKIGQTKDAIQSLNNDIATTQDRIDKRTAILKQQVKATYVQGTQSNMLELLLNANDFGDFVNRAFAVYKITNQQQSLILEQKKDQANLNVKKKKIQADQAAAEQSSSQLTQYVSDLQTLITKQEQDIQTLQGKTNSINGKIKSLSTTDMTPVQTVPAPSYPSGNNSNSSSNAAANHTTPTLAVPKAAMSGSVAGLINVSKKWIGHSTYVFGGGRNAYDQANGRFDCSGFVHWAYDQIGVNLGGWSTSTLQYVGTPVSPSQMQPGDLIFFNTYEPNGHVDIYIGNGQFIGSQSSSGVSIESLSNSYWSSHFSGVVRRVLN
jgi:peptidoglycan DL-endopeptidase CwlO